MLYKNIIFSYDYNLNSNELNDEAWKKMIFSFIENLKSRPNGLLIINSLQKFLDNRIDSLVFSNIKNIGNEDNYIYVPSKNLIYKIPCLIEPLLQSTMDTEEMVSIQIMSKNIFEYKESNFVFSPKYMTELEELIEFKDEDIFSFFVNQIIKVLRFYEKIKLKEDILENAAIIYGINGLSLKINNNLITENVIRKEWNKLPRISPIYFIGI